MARKNNNAAPNQVTSNAQDIGYVLGKMEMIEKALEDHQAETDKKLDSIIDKVELMTSTLSFWRHSLWLLKAILASIPLIAAMNFSSLADLWKDM